MFSWHETTLRGLCRLAFGLLVAVPTCAVLVAIVWCRCPLSTEYYRRAFAEQLALDVQLDRVRFPRPNVTQFQGLSLADPETARPLARFRAVEWRTSGQKSLITCSQAELLDSSRLDLLTELVVRRLRLFAGSQRAVEIQAEQVKLHLADGVAPQTLIDVHGQMQAEPKEPQQPDGTSEPQGTVEFHLEGQEKTDPARIFFYRNPAERGAPTAMKIDTGLTLVPARLINLCCPGWETWGLDSSFRGAFRWQRRADGWAGEVRGSVTDVNLESLVQTRSEHRLTGVAEVQLEGARFQRGRLIEATGSIHAGPGLVGRSLLSAAATQLHFTGNNPAAARGDSAPYDEMAFHFRIDERGLKIKGLCSQSAGTVFIGRVHGRLLGEPIGVEPLLGIVRLLFLGESVPADPPAQLLLSVLPVPAAAPSRSEATPQATRSKESHR